MRLHIRSNALFLALVGLALAILSSIRDFSIPDEGRYGDISRWMVMSHDYLVPRIDGVPFLHKPPLLHWLTALLMEVFGTHIWVARLVPVLAAMVILCSLFWFVHRHYNQQLARLSVLILATSFLFYGASQYVNHDMLVASWITLAVFCFADFVLKLDKKMLMLGYIACGLGVMSKGLIGVLIPGMIILPWILYTKQWRKIPAVLNPFGIGLFLLVVLPWALLMNQDYAGFLHYFFIEQQFDRFSSSGFNNHQPWYFYAACLLVSFLPYLVFAKFKLLSAPVRQAMQAGGLPIFSLMVWWAVSCLVFFSIPTSKLVGYILPMVAPLAVLLAFAVQNVQAGFLNDNLLKENVLNADVLHADVSNKSLSNYPVSQNTLLNKNKPLSAVQTYFAPSFLLLMGVALCGATAMLPEAKIYNANYPVVVGVVMSAAALGLIVALWRRRVAALPATFVATALLCVAITFLFQSFDTKKNANQMAFAQYVTPNTTVIFYQTYFYDVPFYLQTQTPVYVVQDWKTITVDSSFLELKDGLRFEPQQKKYLLDTADFSQFVQHNPQPMVILSNKKAVPDLTGLTYKVLPYRNYDVYVVNPAQ